VIKPGTRHQIAKTKAVEQKTQKLHHHLRATILLAPVAGLAAIVLITGLFFTLAHGSLTDIYVANLPVKATATLLELQRQINTAAKSYKISFKYSDGSSKSFPLTDTGVDVNVKQSAEDAKATINHSLVRRLQWWRPIHLPLATKLDHDKLEAFIANDATEVKLPPKDASLSIVNGKVVVSQAAQGSGSKVVNAEQAITSVVTDLQTKPIALKPAVLAAAITGHDLLSSQTKAQALVSQPVSFTIAGNAVTAKPADIANWIELTPVPKSKTVDVTVDSGKILQYINKIAGYYIRQPRSRLITNTSGGQVVLDTGSNGIDVVNKDQVAATVAQQLLLNKGVNIDLPVYYAVAQTVEVQPYDKWIVVDVTTKRMYAYEQTNLVRSFLVSAGAPATPTVLGQYKIYAKYASQDMTGANADGSRYFQPAVPYVNYFYGGYAIHGNYWRPQSWFGNINSSHGCVGVNVDDGAWIYDWAPIGTPVITHS